MFERFTDRSRRVIELAQKEARTLGSERVHTGHLLFGLADEGEGVAAIVLREFGVTRATVHAQLDGLSWSAEAGVHGFSAGAKKLLEGALREALQLGHSYVGTEHMLLATGRLSPGSTATRVLDAHNLSATQIRDAVMAQLAQYASSTAVQNARVGGSREGERPQRPNPNADGAGTHGVSLDDAVALVRYWYSQLRVASQATGSLARDSEEALRSINPRLADLSRQIIDGGLT